LKQEIFDDCLKMWLSSDGHSEFWKSLAEKWNYPNSESLRQEFKYERKKKGIKKNDEKVILSSIPVDNAKIFVYDLENSFMEVGVFSLFDQNIGVDQIISHSVLICWSGKFLGQDKILHECLTPEEAINKDDSRIVKILWNILNSSNVLIGHNIVGFDNKKINLRFLAHGLPPIRKQNIDTYLIAKKYFDFPSNSLKGINQYLGIKQKKENEGFTLWKKCMNGDKVALGSMQLYCDGDVDATIELYYSVRPFISNPPKLSWFYEDNEKRCPNCGSTNLKETENFVYLSNGKYAEIRCECGAIMKNKENLLTKEKKKSLL
jgi:hypothetical protein